MQNSLTQRTKPRVLVVDADEPVRKALQRVLERAGCETQTAGAARAGAAVLARELVDLIIVDLDTFAYEGESLFEQLLKPQAQFPILVLSRFADAAVRDQADQVGRLLVKPVDGRLLLDTVAALLKPSRDYWRIAKEEQGEVVMRRLQACGARFCQRNLPYHSARH